MSSTMSANPATSTVLTTESSLYKVYFKIVSTVSYEPYPSTSYEVYTEATSHTEAIEKAKSFFDIPAMMIQYWKLRGHEMGDHKRMREIFYDTSQWEKMGILSVEQEEKEIKTINILRENIYDERYRNKIRTLSESEFNEIKDYFFSQLKCENINLNVMTTEVLI